MTRTNAGFRADVRISPSTSPGVSRIYLRLLNQARWRHVIEVRVNGSPAEIESIRAGYFHDENPRPRMSAG